MPAVINIVRRTNILVPITETEQEWSDIKHHIESTLVATNEPEVLKQVDESIIQAPAES